MTFHQPAPGFGSPVGSGSVGPGVGSGIDAPPHPAAPFRLGHWMALLASATTLVLLLVGRDSFERMSFGELGMVGLAIALAALTAVGQFAPRGANSASWLYLLTFCLFHLGMCVMFVFGGWPTDPGAVFYYGLWLYEPETSTAFWLAMLAVPAITTANLAVWLRSPSEAPTHRRDISPHHCSLFGAVLLTGAVPTFVLLVLQSGALGGGYADYLESLGDTGASAAVSYLIAAGLVFAATPARSRARRVALAMFALFVIVALPMGLRTSVLTAATAAVLVYARSRPLPNRTVLLAVVACLAVIGLTREVREEGLAGIASASVSAANPTEALREMGGSIRPVAEVVRWQTILHEPAAGGDTYLSPFGRIGARALGLERSGEVLLGARLYERAGPIGGSTVAEAYHNFGVGGVVVICGLIGGFTASLDRLRPTPLNNVAIGLLMIPLIYAVRQNFSVVPAWLAFGLILLLTARFLITTLSSVARSSSALGRLDASGPNRVGPAGRSTTPVARPAQA